MKQIRDLYYENFVNKTTLDTQNVRDYNETRSDNLYKCLIKCGKKSTETILDEYGYIFDNVFQNHETVPNQDNQVSTR